MILLWVQVEGLERDGMRGSFLPSPPERHCRSGGLVWRDAISALYKASVAALEND